MILAVDGIPLSPHFHFFFKIVLKMIFAVEDTPLSPHFHYKTKSIAVAFILTHRTIVKTSSIYHLLFTFSRWPMLCLCCAAASPPF